MSSRRVREALRKARKLRALVRQPLWRHALRSAVAATVEHDALPLRRDLRMVVDVGANRGQFSVYALARFPSARIVAFEPLAEPRQRMTRLFEHESRVEVLPFAVGADEGEVVMHLSARDDSSSLLPIGGRQVANFPGTQEVGTARAQLRTLDSVLADRPPVRPALLKVDVQGFELPVLRGAVRTLRSFDQILVEASFVELYDGQALFGDIHDFVQAHGFRLVAGRISATDPIGRWLQGDFLYEPADSVNSRGAE